MPRSKPQHTRRRLESAMNHIGKAIVQIHNVLPIGEDIKNWDERYQDLLRMNIRLISVHDYIASLLGYKGEEENEGQDNN